VCLSWRAGVGVVTQQAIGTGVREAAEQNGVPAGAWIIIERPERGGGRADSVRSKFSDGLSRVAEPAPQNSD